MIELYRNTRVDSVSRLRPTPPREVSADQSIADAVERMRADQTGCLLVTRDGHLVGIFTERDLLKNVLAVGRPLTTAIEEVMTENPVSVRAKDPIRLAIRKMQEGGYRHLPVVDDDNRPMGMLSVKRIVHYLVEHFPSTIYNQPPEPHRFPEIPEGA